jgi:hypothetical protein
MRERKWMSVEEGCSHPITGAKMIRRTIDPYIYSMVLGGLGVKSYKTLVTDGISAMILF